MTARRPRGPRRPDPDAWTWRNTGGGIALGVLAAGLIAAMFILQPDGVRRDADTMCPTAGPPATVTAIVIDTTDRIGSTSRYDILGRLDTLAADSTEDDMVLVYESAPIAGGGDREPLSPILTVCHPGDPDAASRWTENLPLLRRRFVNFQDRLRSTFEDLLNREAAEVSPLMENVQAIAITLRQITLRQDDAAEAASPLDTPDPDDRRRHDAQGAAGAGRTAGAADIPPGGAAGAPGEILPREPRSLCTDRAGRWRKCLVLVSDLMQHSDNVSFYPRPPDYDRFAATPGAAALGTDLKNLADVSVEVLLIQRQQTVSISRRGGGLVEFWERWIANQDGLLIGVSKIAGLNR